MKVKVGVFILNYKRPNTVTRVIDSALHQTIKPEAVYIWNNNPETTINYQGCINVNSQENFLCIIRHVVAFTRDIDYWVFIDDDVAMKPKAIENFLEYSKKYPESILGYYGRNITSGLYSLDRSNWYTNKEKEVDMVMGMIHFCKRSKLINSFILKKEIPDLPLTEDDILLSLGNKFIDKQKNYVIPYSNESGPMPLDSGYGGLSIKGGHLQRRIDAVRRILEWAGKMPKPSKREHGKPVEPIGELKEVKFSAKAKICQAK